MRIYDPRVGRFLSVDPITGNYPWYTPYQFAGNTPIQAIDLDGLEPAYTETSGRRVTAREGVLARTPPRPQIKMVTAQVVPEITIAMADRTGHGWIGPESWVREHVGAVEQAHRDEVTDNVKGGPIGTIFYLAGGDKWSYVGAIGDGVAMSSSSEPVFQAEREPKLMQENAPNTLKYDPEKPALMRLNIKIPASLNEGSPDFFGSPYLYQPKPGQANIVKIKLTGSYKADFSQADAIAHVTFPERQGNYTWHHLDDFDPSTGMATLQLVRSDIHIATKPHLGSVNQYEKVHNVKYKR